MAGKGDANPLFGSGVEISSGTLILFFRKFTIGIFLIELKKLRPGNFPCVQCTTADYNFTHFEIAGSIPVIVGFLIPYFIKFLFGNQKFCGYFIAKNFYRVISE